jgi:hypothetical protein
MYLWCGFPGASLDKIAATIGNEYLEKAAKALDTAAVAEQAKNPDFAALNHHLGKPLTRAGSLTRATGGKELWVPPGLKALHAVPENGGTFGAPWLLRTKAAACRTGPNLIPLWGVGHFVIGLKGYAWLVSIPVQEVIDLGEPLEKGWEVLGGFMKPDFNTFWQKHVFHTLVRPGSIAWVPYGHLDNLITLSGQTADYIVVPYCSMAMVNAMEDQVRVAVLETFQRYFHSTISRHPIWRTIGPAFVTWFGNGLPELAADGEEADISDWAASGPRAVM